MKEKLKNVFCDTFEIPENEVFDSEYMSTENWDSVNHMVLIAAIESEFDIEFDMDEIVDLSSFNKALEILSTKL